MNFSDKIALVAGGTGGLGRAVVVAFLNAGARVLVPYRNPADFESLRATAGEVAARLEGGLLDASDAAAVKQFADLAVSVHKRLDILVNCVGGYAGGSKLWETDAETYERMLDLNLKAGYALARAVLPVMIRQGSGCVVNVAGRAGVGPAAGAALYGASKAAAISLFASLAEEVEGWGIRVNSVLPSIMDTPANRAAMPKADFSKWPKTEEVARVILFLCSDDARLIHGAAIPV